MIVLTRKQLHAAACVDVAAAADRWSAALARPDRTDAPTLVALLEDWAEFSGMSYPSMLTAVLGAQEKVDREWAEQQPETPDEVAAFYDKTDTTIPLLLWWHGTAPGPGQCAAAAAEVMTATGARRVLDFGSGIGSTGLVLAHSGIDVVYADVAREALKFAEWRARERGYAPEVLDLITGELADLEPGSLDGVVAFDVFEHLPDAEPTIRAIDRLLAVGGTIVHNQAFVPEDRDEPEHYPQRGEVLVLLHDLGYRLTHVRDLGWVAQKAPLTTAETRRQRNELRARITATRIFEHGRGPIGRRVSFYGLRYAIS